MTDMCLCSHLQTNHTHKLYIQRPTVHTNDTLRSMTFIGAKDR